MRFQAIAVFLAVTGLAGCHSVPVVQGPPNLPDPVVVPAVDPSVINIPVSLDLDTLRDDALKQIPSPLAAGNTTQVMRINFNPGGQGNTSQIACSVTSLNCLASRAGTTLGRALTIDYTAPVETQITYQAFVRDLQMRMTGNQFTVTTQIEFSVGTRINSSLTQFGVASCGINEPMPKIEFTLPGTVNWDADGDLTVTPGKWTMKWLKPCNITAFKLNVETLLNLPGIRGKVEDAITTAISTNLKQYGIKAALNKAWPLLNEPKQVEDGVWLMLNPDKVGFADITGNGRTVTTAITVKARPYVTSGQKPKVKLPPVPDPERLPLTEGFHIALLGDITLDKVNQLLNQRLAGKPFDANGRTILIDKLQVYGSGNKAVIGITLTKPIQGEIYALAHPVFDVDKNEVRFEDLDFTLDTSSMLAKTANWMLHDSVRNTLAQKARFRFDDDLQDALKDFRNYRQDLGNGAVIRANLEHVRPQGLYFTADSLKAYVLLDGKLWLDVGQARKP